MGTRRGFTLIELLVVIAIIGLLLAILVPGLSVARSLARTAVCRNNLHHISAGVRNVQAIADLKGQADGFSVCRWRLQLKQYLQEEVFICPEDDPELGYASGGSGSGSGSTWPVGIHAWAGYNTDDYIQKFETGTLMRKLSDEQYSAGRFQDGKRVANPPEFEPGSDPSVCWYIMEDWHFGYEHGNCDFDWDLHIKVTENTDGTISLLLKQFGTGYNFELIDLASNEVLMTKGQMNGRPPGAEYSFGGRGVVGGVGGGWALSSYGLNEAFLANRRSGGQKILALDYEAHIVYPDGDLWTDDIWDEDNDDILDFARHHGAINVLFEDGSVETRRPEQIDPYYPTIRDAYWVGGQ